MTPYVHSEGQTDTERSVPPADLLKCDHGMPTSAKIVIYIYRQIIIFGLIPCKRKQGLDPPPQSVVQRVPKSAATCMIRARHSELS